VRAVGEGGVAAPGGRGPDGARLAGCTPAEASGPWRGPAVPTWKLRLPAAVGRRSRLRPGGGLPRQPASTSAAGAGGPKARPGGLTDEDRTRGRVVGARERVDEPRVAARDQHAAGSVGRIGEEVAEPPVLTRRHARRPALADRADVDRPASRVDRPVDGARAARRAEDRLLADRDVRRRAVDVDDLTRVRLVPDDRDPALAAGDDPRPEDERVARRRDP